MQLELLIVLNFAILASVPGDIEQMRQHSMQSALGYLFDSRRPLSRRRRVNYKEKTMLYKV